MERWLRKLILRARSLFRARHVEAELDDELRFHLETRIEQGLARGLTAEAARRAAALALEGVEQQKEACRDTRGVRWMDHFARDVRHGVRVLRAHPGFTLAAVLSLALGLGANTAIFQVIDAVRLRTLPVARPTELAEIQLVGGNRGFGITNGTNAQATYPLWEQIRQQQRSFASVFAWGQTQMLLGKGPDARVARVLWMSGEAFPTLELRPAAGRLFNPGDERPVCVPSVVLSHAFWQAQFGGDPAVSDRTLHVLDRALPIVGVAPQAFFGLEVGSGFDIALPTCATATWGGRLDRRDWFWLDVVGRLKPGWTLPRAAADIHALSGPMFEATEPSGYSEERRGYYRAFRLTAEPFGTGVSGLRSEYGDVLWLLLAMTGLVLVLACTNIMNLLLARATAREHEIALRVAIGASRRRVIAQLLVESLLLAAAGSLLGGVIAHPLSTRLVSLLSTEGNPLYLDMRPNWHVLVFTFAAGVAACLLFGLVPALRASRLDPGMAMKSGGRGLTATREHLFMQRSLIVAQVVVSLVLIFGATLFARTFQNLVKVDLGIKQENLVVVRLGDFSAGRRGPELLAAQHDELLQAIRSLPQVASAASTTKVPMDGSSWTFAIVTAGGDPSRDMTSKFTYVSTRYFATSGMHLLAGRDFGDTDRRGSKPVLVVNQTFVRRHLPNSDPIGSIVRTVAEPGFPETAFEVIGVVSDTKYSGIRENSRPIAFVPLVQHPSPSGWPALLIRASGPPAQTIAAVKRAITERHPNMTMGFSLLEEELDNGLIRERVMAWLAGGFGAVAALLALIGIYGVVSYVVQRRRHELAIRLALGAGRRRIVRLVAGQLGVLLGVGLALGVGCAVAVARTANSLLFGLTWYDPAALVTSFAMLALIAAIACAVPALRASRIEEISALRSE